MHLRDWLRLQHAQDIAERLDISLRTLRRWATAELTVTQQHRIKAQLSGLGFDVSQLWPGLPTLTVVKQASEGAAAAPVVPSPVFLPPPDGAASGQELTITLRPRIRLVIEPEFVLPPGSQEEPQTTLAEDDDMLSTREYLEPRELKHFNLKSDPFEDLPSGTAWLSERGRWIYSQMTRTARAHGILALVGEVGSGKSTLLRHWLTEMRANRQIAICSPSSISRSEMNEGALVQAILRSLAPQDAMPGSHEARSEKVRSLLEASLNSGMHPVLVVEEAHDLSQDALIALKRLWDSFELYKALAIIMVGQGNSAITGKIGLTHLRDLEARLKDLKVRELGQRTRVVRLEPLTESEVGAYVGWRFQQVGGEASSVFKPDAYAALAANRPQAYPLALVNVAVQAMRLATQLGDDMVTAAHIKRATTAV